ncbi:MAG: DciA family protein [Actinomycetota bacterium]|nr:DciA family protein [Actinomycetota bacterium]
MSDDTTPAPGADDGIPVGELTQLAPPEQVARRALERAKAAARDRGLTPGQPGRRRRRPVVEAQLAASGRDPMLLGDTAANLLAERGWSDEVAVGGVIGRWREVVGDQIAEHCTPESFDEGRLVVRTDSTAWATNLRMLVPELLSRLAKDLGEGVVEEVTVLAPVGPSFKRGPRDTWV